MSRKLGPQLPPTVTLKVGRYITASDLRTALKANSRATIYNWSKNYGLPKPVKREGKTTYSDVAEISKWLFRYGVAINLV